MRRIRPSRRVYTAIRLGAAIATMCLSGGAFAETVVLDHFTLIDGTGRAPVADQALVMSIDLEKTRIRHGQCISGTFVPCLPDLDDDWGNPLPTVCPDPPPVRREASPSASADALGDASRQTEPPPRSPPCRDKPVIPSPRGR